MLRFCAIILIFDTCRGLLCKYVPGLDALMHENVYEMQRQNLGEKELKYAKEVIEKLQKAEKEFEAVEEEQLPKKDKNVGSGTVSYSENSNASLFIDLMANDYQIVTRDQAQRSASDCCMLVLHLFCLETHI